MKNEMNKKSQHHIVNTQAQLQEQIREVCGRGYDEFHRVSPDHGFTTITIPQKNKRKSFTSAA
ncbi:MAG: hypothetical protein OXT65_03885 [Alphaproteobacteria bacterium]|nr:hypothetical protein [Alphaproteobacteria bacterium]